MAWGGVGCMAWGDVREMLDFQPKREKEVIKTLTLNLLTTTTVAPPSNASKWQMGFNSAFKGLIAYTMD